MATSGDDDEGSLRETVDVLSSPALVRDIREALDDAEAGRVFTHAEVVADLVKSGRLPPR